MAGCHAPGALRRMIPYIRSEYKSLTGALVLMITGVLLQLPLPLVTRQMIDVILPRADFVQLNWVIAGLIALMLCKGGTDILQHYVLTLTRERILLKIQADLVGHVYGLSLSFFKDRRSGHLIARINNDVANLGGLLSGTVLSVLKDGTTFLVGAVLIFTLHWKLALASLLVLPFFATAIRMYSARIKQCSAAYQESFAGVWDALQQALSAMSLVKAFQTEEHERSRFIDAVRVRIRAVVRMGVVSSFSSFTTAFIGGFGALIVLWYGGREVIAGRLTLGTLMAFNVFVGYLFGPVQRLMNVNSEVQTSLASLDRVLELFDVVPDVADPDRPVRWTPTDATVVFERVHFSYEPGKPVLKGVSLTALPGETVAIVGMSGAGKTTLVCLVPRFYDPQAGSISINGIDIRCMTQADLRRAIAIVPQDTHMMAGTIRDNICYGSSGVSDEEIREVAAASNALEFILRLPQGFDTEVGERGVKLSGGERQRIAIARAMLRKPKILILDEATSEMDSQSERLIRQACAVLCHNRTTFVVAHRFATVLNADKILVLDDGHIIAEGRHEEIFGACELYRALCRNQFITRDTSPWGLETLPTDEPAEVAV